MKDVHRFATPCDHATRRGKTPIVPDMSEIPAHTSFRAVIRGVEWSGRSAPGSLPSGPSRTTPGRRQDDPSHASQ